MYVAVLYATYVLPTMTEEGVHVHVDPDSKKSGCCSGTVIQCITLALYWTCSKVSTQI